MAKISKSAFSSFFCWPNLRHFIRAEPFEVERKCETNESQDWEKRQEEASEGELSLSRLEQLHPKSLTRGAWELWFREREPILHWWGQGGHLTTITYTQGEKVPMSEKQKLINREVSLKLRKPADT